MGVGNWGGQKAGPVSPVKVAQLLCKRGLYELASQQLLSLVKLALHDIGHHSSTRLHACKNMMRSNISTEKPHNVGPTLRKREREREREKHSHPCSRPNWAYWMKQPTPHLKCQGCLHWHLKAPYTQQAQVHQIKYAALRQLQLQVLSAEQTQSCFQTTTSSY